MAVRSDLLPGSSNVLSIRWSVSSGFSNLNCVATKHPMKTTESTDAMVSYG